MLPILPPQRHTVMQAALGPGGDKPPPLGGSGGLGGLKPPPRIPGLGDFGRPKPKPSQANLSPLGMYLLNTHG